MEKLKIERTKSGLPAMWECGGGYSNTGDATIVAGKDGKAKKPVYVKRGGHLACQNHALIPIVVGDYIVEASHHRVDFKMDIYKITGFENGENETFAFVEQVSHFSRGEWDVEPPEHLNAAIEAAMQKATCYHCREPHYVYVE